jgi:hypothetical protein
VAIRSCIAGVLGGDPDGGTGAGGLTVLAERPEDNVVR